MKTLTPEKVEKLFKLGITTWQRGCAFEGMEGEEFELVDKAIGYSDSDIQKNIWIGRAAEYSFKEFAEDYVPVISYLDLVQIVMTLL